MVEDLSSIPIEIGVSKLLDWLVSRNHCNKDWPEKISVVRQKINDALQDMPESDVLAKILVEASPINYYHCIKIVDVLKETEADSKNIFGMYGSRRMKDWQEILKLYQKDNLNLAECASILSRTVIYEIPSLKRLSAKLEQRESECIKRSNDSKKQAQDCRDRFLHECNQLGLKFDLSETKIPTVNAIGLQLVAQMSQKLPEIFDRIVRKTMDIQPAINFYKRFLKVTVGDEAAADASCCSLLSTVIEKGNVTTYEWKYGEPPVKVEKSEINYAFEQETEDYKNEIDFGANEIDFGVDTNIELETGEIDWGDTTVDLDYSSSADVPATNINFDVSGIVIEEDGIDGGIARDAEALSVLENVITRNEFIDDLYELQGFLTQRSDESKTTSNEMMFADNEDILRDDNLAAMLSFVNQVLAMFNEISTKQYLLVRESKEYVTRLAEAILQNLKLANKLDHISEQSLTKAKEIEEEMKQIGPKIHLFTKQSRQLQTELIKEITKKYSNRIVHITGGV